MWLNISSLTLECITSPMLLFRWMSSPAKGEGVRKLASVKRERERKRESAWRLLIIISFPSLSTPATQTIRSLREEGFGEHLRSFQKSTQLCRSCSIGRLVVSEFEGCLRVQASAENNLKWKSYLGSELQPQESQCLQSAFHSLWTECAHAAFKSTLAHHDNGLPFNLQQEILKNLQVADSPPLPHLPFCLGKKLKKH